jgi:DNA-binding MarR family transcriptional regulator
MTHLHILSMLDHHGELTMSHLADLLDVSLSNATGLIDRVEERGLVERARDNVDRRVVTVRLTGHGREQLRDIQLVKQELLQKILQRLDATELQAVGHALQILRAAAVNVAGDTDVAAYWHAHTHSDAHVAPIEQGGTPNS